MTAIDENIVDPSNEQVRLVIRVLGSSNIVKDETVNIQYL